MISHSIGQSDFCGCMRRWEPLYIGPKQYDCCNYNVWEQLEYSEPQFIKNNKLVKPSDSKIAKKALKAAACVLSKGKLNIKG